MDMQTEYEKLVEREQFQLEKDARLGKKTREFLGMALVLTWLFSSGALAFGFIALIAKAFDANPFGVTSILEKYVDGGAVLLFTLFVVLPGLTLVILWGLMALWCLSVGDDIPRFCFLPEKEEPQARKTL